MKLLRHGSPGQEKPGLLAADGEIRDLSGIIPDLSGESLLPSSIEKVRNIDISLLPRIAGRPRIGPCVGGVGKFICIGLNYSDHAAESGMAVPVEPVVFMKQRRPFAVPTIPLLFRADPRRRTGRSSSGWSSASRPSMWKRPMRFRTLPGTA